ncbi:hypothetical protein BGX27_008204 [Mortierella sp. AM989]|nr:hypothetical protein BGX27_008204 [Mortierella sp. AM989]
MADHRPLQIAKKKVSVSIKESLPPPEYSDLTDSDSNGDKPPFAKKFLDKGKGRRRESTPGGEDGISLNSNLDQSLNAGKKPKKQEKRKKKTKALERKMNEPQKTKKRPRDRTEGLYNGADDGDNGGDNGGNNGGASGSKNDTPHNVKMKSGIRKNIKANLQGAYIPNVTEAPLMSLVHSLMTQEQKAARALALMVLDGKVDDETYRWPVRENLLPSVPKSSFMDVSAETDFFEQQGMGFVEELTGMPKTEADYSGSDESTGESDQEVNSANEAQEELELHRRRMAKKRKKLRQERHANEKMANDRLEKVNGFLREEITAFAQKQYRKGIPHRIKNLYAFQKQTLPPFRIQAARSSIGNSKAGDEEDELTPIQENAAAFAAEDSLRRILDRLPYVIRQGALGEAPDYVKLGLPKPVSSVAEYERGWDTLMAAASIAGVEDRILKKVGLRMKNLLSQSRHSRYYESPSKAKFATTESNESCELMENQECPKIKVPFMFYPPPPPKEVWDAYPAPLYLSREFIDPLDPKYSVASTMKNVRERRKWLVEPSLHKKPKGC